MPVKSIKPPKMKFFKRAGSPSNDSKSVQRSVVAKVPIREPEFPKRQLNVRVINYGHVILVS